MLCCWWPREGSGPCYT